MKKLILFIAIALIGVGIYNGEFADVLSKATRICMECIGIG
ncbi:CD1871A family CXXC motif-containing protein [Anaerosphaera multitolerans]|nr:CD1871A family CXXC motif-containing protein [Anaerosphaera multitolerans]